MSRMPPRPGLTSKANRPWPDSASQVWPMDCTAIRSPTALMRSPASGSSGGRRFRRAATARGLKKQDVLKGKLQSAPPSAQRGHKAASDEPVDCGARHLKRSRDLTDVVYAHRFRSTLGRLPVAGGGLRN